MISSLSDKVDTSIVHVGRYVGFDDPHNLAEDCTRLIHIATLYGCKVIVSMPSTEIEKRQQTAKLAEKEGIDFLLIIDSDEYIDKMQTDWPKFQQACIDICINKWKEKFNIFGVKVEDGPQTYRYLPRLWFKPQYIYYDRTHYGIKTRDPNCPYTNTDTKAGDIEKHPTTENMPHLTIRSDRKYRTDYHKNMRASYENILNNNDNLGLLDRK